MPEADECGSGKAKLLPVGVVFNSSAGLTCSRACFGDWKMTRDGGSRRTILMYVGMGTVADTRRPAQVRGPEETMGSGVNGERYYQGCGFVK